MRIAALFIIFAGDATFIEPLLNKFDPATKISAISDELLFPRVVLFHQTFVVPHDLMLAHFARAEIARAIKTIKPDPVIGSGLAQHGHRGRQLAKFLRGITRPRGTKDETTCTKLVW
jgi:hypothetical protein